MTTNRRDGNASATGAPDAATGAPAGTGPAGSQAGGEGVVVRTARAGDAPALAVLSTELGYPADTAQIERRLGAVLAADDDVVFVAVARPETPSSASCTRPRGGCW